MFRGVLTGIDPCVDIPSHRDVSIAFNFFTAVVKTLKKADLALVQIVDKLYNDGILRDTDDERSHAKQLVFAAFGWMSTLSLNFRGKDV